MRTSASLCQVVRTTVTTRDNYLIWTNKAMHICFMSFKNLKEEILNGKDINEV